MILGLLIPAWLKRWALGIGAAALAMIAAFGMGRREAKRDALADKAEAELETRKRIDDADDVGGDPARAREWMREHGAK